MGSLARLFQLLCLAAALVVGAGLAEGAPRALAALPLLLGLLSFLENPAPSAAVGKEAAPLGPVEWIEGKAACGPSGALKRGHVYLLAYWRLSPPCQRALPALERAWRRCQAALPVGRVHCVLVASGDVTKEALRAFAQRWGGQLTMSLAHDVTGAAFTGMYRHGVPTLPHAVLVGEDGVVCHAGNANYDRGRRLARAVDELLLVAAAPAQAGEKRE